MESFCHAVGLIQFEMSFSKIFSSTDFGATNKQKLHVSVAAVCACV